MNKRKSLLLSVFGVLSISALLLAGVNFVQDYASLSYFEAGPIRPYWLGPTNTFKTQYDRNRDGEISRAEWEHSGEQTNLLSNIGSVRSFAYADCNEDGRLSWREYYDFWFTNDGCDQETSYQKIIRAWSPQYKDDKFPFPLIIPVRYREPDEENLFSNENSYIVEEALGEGYASNVPVNCVSLGSKRVPEQYRIYEANLVQVAECEIQNRLVGYSITSVLLETKYSRESQPVSSVNLKSVYIAPSELYQLRIFIPRGMLFEEVNLLSAKGMRKD